jgi:hypothetical protein
MRGRLGVLYWLVSLYLPRQPSEIRQTASSSEPSSCGSFNIIDEYSTHQTRWRLLRESVPAAWTRTRYFSLAWMRLDSGSAA